MMTIKKYRNKFDDDDDDDDDDNECDDIEHGKL